MLACSPWCGSAHPLRTDGDLVTRARHPDPVRVPRLLRHRLLAAALLLATASGAFAEGTPATTALEAGPYDRAAAVLVIRVTQVAGVRTPQVVRGRVLHTLKGSVQPGADVSIVVVGQRPTLDPARPSVPYFRKGKHERYVVFLGHGRGRHAWQFQTLFDAEGRAA